MGVLFICAKVYFKYYQVELSYVAETTYLYLYHSCLFSWNCIELNSALQFYKTLVYSIDLTFLAVLWRQQYCLVVRNTFVGDNPVQAPAQLLPSWVALGMSPAFSEPHFPY